MIWMFYCRCNEERNGRVCRLFLDGVVVEFFGLIVLFLLNIVL